MCGIIGVFGRKEALKAVKTGLKVLKYRGRDGSGVLQAKGGALGHCLHSVVGKVRQPIRDEEAALVSNCEIYNWQELNATYGLNAKNDSDVLFRLLLKRGIASLSELDGVYAFAFLSKGKLILARDMIGVKPLWYSYSGSKGPASKGFAFASEKKALEHMGYSSIEELNPREILVYTPETEGLARIKREFFSAAPQLKDPEKKIVKHLRSLIEAAVKKRIPARKFGVLFSGGVDSSTIALLLRKFGQKFSCYTVAFDDPALRIPEDLFYSQKVAEALKLDHTIIRLKLGELEKQLKIIVPLIEDSNVVKVEVALTFFAACAAARRDGCKVLFSGLGSEEIFAGYQRHRQVRGEDINKECISGLLKLYERDLYRDDVITMYHSLELRLPYLDKNLAEYALRIPGELKLKGDEEKCVEKYILRQAALSLGLPEEFALRRKLAAQYGSNMGKAVEKLAKKRGFRLKSDYLRTFYSQPNMKLAAMISSGKDGLFAAYRMARQNYEIACFVTMRSANPDSYMFHTPNSSMAGLQAQAAGIPIIEQDTAGEKEKELEDLGKALGRAKKEHGIQGVVTGALYSNYQRERIEKVCDRLGLKVFSPLWHMDQEQELRQLLKEGFEIILSSVAAEGLDKSWLGRPITNKDVDRLVQLHKKHGINIAGEGGEYESLVVDCPLFRQKIRVVDSDIIEEAEHTAKYVVKRVELTKKVGLTKKTFEKTF